jgi:hypothetical protein
MLILLLFMHHIALCTPCIALFNCDHLLHIRVDHTEPKSEIQTEQVQREYGGPQAPNVRIPTLLLGQGKPWCITPQSLIFIFEFNIFMLRMIVH